MCRYIFLLMYRCLSVSFFRFSKDIELIDKNVPMNANLTMSNIVWTLLLIIVICVMSVYFVVVVGVALPFFWVLTVSYFLLIIIALLFSELNR